MVSKFWRLSVRPIEQVLKKYLRAGSARFRESWRRDTAIGSAPAERLRAEAICIARQCRLPGGPARAPSTTTDRTTRALGGVAVAVAAGRFTPRSASSPTSPRRSDRRARRRRPRRRSPARRSSPPPASATGLFGAARKPTMTRRPRPRRRRSSPASCGRPAPDAPRPVPRRHFRSYGSDPLPSGEQVLDEPLYAFPSWFLRIVRWNAQVCENVRLSCTRYRGVAPSRGCGVDGAMASPAYANCSAIRACSLCLRRGDVGLPVRLPVNARGTHRLGPGLRVLAGRHAGIARQLG